MAKGVLLKSPGKLSTQFGSNDLCTWAALGWLCKTLFPSSSCAFPDGLRESIGRVRKRKGQERQPENSFRKMSFLYFYVVRGDGCCRIRTSATRSSLSTLPNSVFSNSNRGSSYLCWQEGFRLVWLLVLMYQEIWQPISLHPAVWQWHAYLLKLWADTSWFPVTTNNKFWVGSNNWAQELAHLSNSVLNGRKRI